MSDSTICFAILAVRVVIAVWDYFLPLKSGDFSTR